MSFNSDFEREFMQRSLSLVQGYRGPHDATLLLNCLLGLLIVPKENCIKSIPNQPISELTDWGISPAAIVNLGKSRGDDDNAETLRGLVWRLRNAVAHFRFRPYPVSGEVEGFYFSDESGFNAKVPISDLRTFVEKLAGKLYEL